MESNTYTRALCRGFYGHFVGDGHGHFVGQAYRLIPIDPPIVGRARLWKAKTAFTQDAGPGDHGTYTHSQTTPKSKPCQCKAKKTAIYPWACHVARVHGPTLFSVRRALACSIEFEPIQTQGRSWESSSLGVPKGFRLPLSLLNFVFPVKHRPSVSSRLSVRQRSAVCWPAFP